MPLELSIIDVNLRHIMQVADEVAQAYLAQLQARALAGDGFAEAALGRLHLEGWRVPRDARLACQHFARGAALGNASALNSLGVMLRDGLGADPVDGLGNSNSNWNGNSAGQPDLAAAERCFSRAAEQGLPEAQFNLAALLWTPDASAATVQRSLGLMGQAAEADLLIAQAELGRQLAGMGALLGELCDAEQAQRWLARAAERGDAGAQYQLGLLLLGGFGGGTVDVLGNTGDVAAAKPWFRRAALQGEAGAQLILGNYLWFGVAGPAQPARALRWFHRAARQGLADAQHNLAVALYEGQGAPADAEQARHWFAQAAQQDHTDALNNLGVMALRGEGGPLNWAQAGRAMQRAAQLGHSGAQQSWASLLWARALQTCDAGDEAHAQADQQAALQLGEQAAAHEFEPEAEAQLELALRLALLAAQDSRASSDSRGGEGEERAAFWLRRALQTLTPADLLELAQDCWHSVQRARGAPAQSAFRAWPRAKAQTGWFAACVAKGLAGEAGSSSDSVDAHPALDAVLSGLQAELGDAQAQQLAGCVRRLLAALGRE